MKHKTKLTQVPVFFPFFFFTLVDCNNPEREVVSDTAVSEGKVVLTGQKCLRSDLQQDGVLIGWHSASCLKSYRPRVLNACSERLAH